LQIKNRIAELTDDLNQSEYLIQKAEKEMSNLKQLKEDKTTELLQVNTCSQFRQHFTSSFCADILLSKNFKAKMKVEKNILKTLSYKKVVCKF